MLGKPLIYVKKGTNIVQPDPRDSVTVWLDLDDKDARRRYKLFRSWRNKASATGWDQTVYFSEDGIHWGEPLATSGPSGDRNTVFYNPFRKVWVWSVRTNDAKMGRTRGYVENADVLAGARWKAVGDPSPWIGADRDDPRRDDLKVQPQLYNPTAWPTRAALGLFSICAASQGPSQAQRGVRRLQPRRLPLAPARSPRPHPGLGAQGDWNWGNVQSAGGCCLIVGDQLYFYVSGRPA